MDNQAIGPNTNVVDIVEQPKPKFTLLDLESKLSAVYLRTMNVARFSTITNLPEDEKNLKSGLAEANGILQELIAIVDKCKSDLEVIEMPRETNETIATIIKTEKPEFYVSGVQMVRKEKNHSEVVEGTSLYSTVIKARSVRDVLNAKYAELKANYVARILQYPVF